MTKYTSYQDRYFAEQLLLKRPQSSYDSLASAMSGVKVDLNPHQVDAALFAMQSPLSSGVLMADEVGLGKTIEAGLVLAQYWAERKRNILLIVPAALRTQWRSELSEKFYIDSLILESSNFNKMRKEGCLNPFDAKNQVVICSYNFAANKDSFVHAMPWDLVVLDEAHRLRNVYKPQNVTANKLKNALNLVTVFKYLLLQFLPAAFSSLPVVDFGWPGIPVTLFGETFQWNILGYDSAHGGLPYFCAYMVAMVVGECINFPIQRNFVFRSKGNLVKQIAWYVVAFCLITCIVNSINCVWVAVAGLLVPDFIYNIGTTVLNGGISMVIFFFVNKIIFPEGTQAK